MANEIILKFKSEASWTKAEKEDLLDGFTQFIAEMDDDAVEDSFSIEIAEENTDTDTDTDAKEEQIRAKAIELLQAGGIKVAVEVTDSYGVTLVSSKLQAHS